MKWILIILVVWLILAAISAVVFPFACIDIFSGMTGYCSTWALILVIICGVILCPFFMTERIVKKIKSEVSKIHNKIDRGSAKE